MVSHADYKPYESVFWPFASLHHNCEVVARLGNLISMRTAHCLSSGNIGTSIASFLLHQTVQDGTCTTSSHFRRTFFFSFLGDS